jgi:hypothetical protein
MGRKGPGRNLNPTDVFRKQQRKKELKKNKIKRDKQRENILLKKDPKKIQEQIRKLESQEATGKLDKTLKSKKRKLLEVLDQVKEKQGASQDNGAKEKGDFGPRPGAAAGQLLPPPGGIYVGTPHFYPPQPYPYGMAPPGGYWPGAPGVAAVHVPPILQPPGAFAGDQSQQAPLPPGLEPIGPPGQEAEKPPAAKRLKADGSAGDESSTGVGEIQTTGGSTAEPPAVSCSPSALSSSLPPKPAGPPPPRPSVPPPKPSMPAPPKPSMPAPPKPSMPAPPKPSTPAAPRPEGAGLPMLPPKPDGEPPRPHPYPAGGAATYPLPSAAAPVIAAVPPSGYHSVAAMPVAGPPPHLLPPAHHSHHTQATGLTLNVSAPVPSSLNASSTSTMPTPQPPNISHIFGSEGRPTATSTLPDPQSSGSTMEPTSAPSPSLTALVPAALRVKRPTAAPSRTASKPALSFLSTAAKKKTQATTSTVTGPTKEKQKQDKFTPETDDAYRTFLEDMKELGAIQE